MQERAGAAGAWFSAIDDHLRFCVHCRLLALTLRAKSAARVRRNGSENSQMTRWLEPVMIAQFDEVDEGVAVVVAIAPRSDYNRSYDIKARCLESDDDTTDKVRPQSFWPAVLAWLWACTTLFAIYSWIFIELISRARADN
jgi:hypothetical protein